MIWPKVKKQLWPMSLEQGNELESMIFSLSCLVGYGLVPWRVVFWTIRIRLCNKISLKTSVVLQKKNVTNLFYAKNGFSVFLSTMEN